MQPVLLGLFRVLCSSFAASCLHAPISWSPDGSWIAYTVIEPAGAAPIAQGWLCKEEPSKVVGQDVDQVPEPVPGGESVRYRIWATQRSGQASVLIEDSPFPLSSPAWGPDGHSLFFSRFIPEPAMVGNLVRGRYELVVQQALDRRRVIPLRQELVLEPGKLASLVELRGTWSPDGRFIVIGRPGPPALLVVLAEQGRVLKTLLRASQPAWSPDGARLALLRLGRDSGSGWTLQTVARDFGGMRSLLELAEPFDQPAWSEDGQSILLAGKKTRLQSRDLELMRVFLDSGLAVRALPLGSSRPGEPARWFSISLDRDQEQCVFSADQSGEVAALAFANISRQQRLKTFHPLDVSLRVGSLALDPEGQLIAARIETAGHLAPVLLCNPSSEAVTLLAPDAIIRREWLVSLVSTVRELLQANLPRPVLDGHPIPRQGLLPLPGEIVDQSPVLPRLRHLGKIGRGFLDQPPGETGNSAGDEPAAESLDEFRLCFDYLHGDYAAALVDLDLLQSRPELRPASLLPLRALILQAQGESQRARDIAEYLVKSRGEKRAVEETSGGFVFAPVEDHLALWYRYLAQRLSMVAPASTPAPGELQLEEEAIQFLVPNLLRRWNGGENGGAARFPFPNRLPGPVGPGVGRFGGPVPGRIGGDQFGPRRAQQGHFPPAPPQPFIPGGPLRPRRRRNGQGVFQAETPPGSH